MNVNRQTQVSANALRRSLVCPLCLGTLEYNKVGMIICRLCRAEFPNILGHPNFLTSRVMELVVSRGIPKSSLTQWFKSMQITESWRDKKASYVKNNSTFSPKLMGNHRLNSSVIQKFLDIRLFAKNRWILDIGCGTGFRANQFIESNYLGLDPSPAAANCGAPFAQGIAECMPIRSSFFDVILCIEVFDHLISPDHAIEEILRVIKPSGCLYIVVGDAEDEFFSLHKQSRQMFGIPEAEAHLHQFSYSFFQQKLGTNFSKLEIDRSKGFLFVYGLGRINDIES